MEGNLFIVESPTKAREISEFLKKEPVQYKVVSSRGHIRDLSEKKLSVDIAHGFRPEYEIPADKVRVVRELKALAARYGRISMVSITAFMLQMEFQSFFILTFIIQNYSYFLLYCPLRLHDLIVQ